jgi:hypothetical protein
MSGFRWWLIILQTVRGMGGGFTFVLFAANPTKFGQSNEDYGRVIELNPVNADAWAGRRGVALVEW